MFNIFFSNVDFHFQFNLGDFEGMVSERFSLPQCAWDGLRYFIVALPEPSI